ncbi:MAG TPA: hypothetical protein PKX48_01080 [Planctomycetota bacterium]|jgi:hypothetical protein|nr:hypothetical protein [Planctomycetota bacterium]OQC22013.1 MAG: hypothetical protein BWX69_00321 [Planctomycetes bacterium ADurb.Bin069]NMD36223.1 hypothetical protein [Planctomycetota bacterium]HNR98104.1 hypothetical protein [Planctomycetota bacterium]HNU25533.1 hypothetical protein [Planctomycetota bacterium]
MAQSTAPLRVSIDLGSSATRMCFGDAAASEVRFHSTVFAPSDAPDTYVLGEEVFRRRLTPIEPLPAGHPSEQECAIFLRLLRAIAGEEGRPAWAVLSSPSSGSADASELLARIAGRAFDGALVIPGLTLATFVLKDVLTPDRGFTLIGVGSTSIQIALVEQSMREPGEIVHISGGTASLDGLLREELRALVPDIDISDRMLGNLRRKYARFARSQGACLVQVIRRNHRRILDIGPAMERSTAPLIDNLVAATLHVLGRSPGAAAAYGADIVLTGGGAQIPGIADALLAALAAHDLPVENVIVPDHAGELVMRGGFKVALMLTSEHWDVLV